MKQPPSSPAQDIATQGLAAWIDRFVNAERRIPLYQALDELQKNLDQQDQHFAKALSELDRVREQLQAPEHILGSAYTKHGEMAEFLEIGLRRAEKCLVGAPPDAFKSLNRFGPEDFGIAGVGVQSKFINGANRTLEHVLDHAKRYPWFASDSTAEYHVPKDQYAQIVRVLQGDSGDFSDRTVQSIRASVAELEHLKGRAFTDLIKPAPHTYPEVQLGNIPKTLTKEETNLGRDNQSHKTKIVDENRDKVRDAEVASAPTLSELGKMTLAGAGVGAGLQVTVTLYDKWRKEGKLPHQLNGQDWKELAAKSGKGAFVGGISAAMLYGLTNYSALGAPFAGAVVSSGRAMAVLVQQYRNGDIQIDEFTALSMISTTEAGIVAGGAALGQVIIPIPVVGAVIGSSAARLASLYARQLLGKQADAIAERLEQQCRDMCEQLGEEHRALLAQLDEKMISIGDALSMAFDPNLNEGLLQASVRLAEECGVPPDQIIRDTESVDRIFKDVSRGNLTYTEVELQSGAPNPETRFQAAN
jgi:hypothetical protein